MKSQDTTWKQHRAWRVIFHSQDTGSLDSALLTELLSPRKFSMCGFITHSVPFVSLGIFGLREIALWGVPVSWDEASTLLWNCAHSPASVSVRLLLLHAEHLVSFGPLFSFQVLSDGTIFPVPHCPTTRQCTWGSCYVGIVPPPGNSVGLHGQDEGIYTGCRPSSSATDFNYKDVWPVVLRRCFKFSPSYQTWTDTDEAGEERKRFYEHCMMPCSFSYLKLFLQ